MNNSNRSLKHSMSRLSKNSHPKLLSLSYTYSLTDLHILYLYISYINNYC